MRLRLADVALFVRVAELGTLSAAARERDVPVSQVTRSLARLEAHGGALLMHRTTHGLSLTDEGDTMLAYGRRLLETAAELDGELRGRVSGPSGWVRVSMSLVIGQVLIAPSLAKLYERHPQLQLDLAADDRVVDLARDGIDIAIRTGELDNENLVARQLGHFARAVVASPRYLERFGTPRTVEDLTRHHLIAHSVNPQMNRWPVRGGDKKTFFQVRGQTRSDDITLTLALLKQGVGIGRVMDLLVLPLIRGGELVALLEDQIDPQRVPIHALMLQERHRLPKVRACIDYWAEWISTMQVA
ncbi:MAG: LysR family transcriptional regulator [Vicinamibacterales bacterium]